MTLSVVVALVVFLALTVGAFLLGACRASREAQVESRRHVEELRRAFEAEVARGQKPTVVGTRPRETYFTGANCSPTSATVEHHEVEA